MGTIIIQYLPAFLLAFATLTANAQAIHVAKLDSLCASLESSHAFMGSIVVSKNGQVAYNRNIGFSDLASGKNTSTDTRYRIGSITKTYTAAMIFKAVDENNLSLEQTLDRYFPQIVHADKITIRHLLNHTSGIPNFTRADNYLTYHTQGKSRKKMLDIMAASGSNFEPGAKTEYSNSNFLLLSYILEKTYKKPYAHILRKKITRPLGLQNTYFGGKIAPNKNEAFSYKLDSVWVKQPETSLPMLSGAGGIISTPTDVIKFWEALFNGKVISPKSLEEMKTQFLGVGDFSFEDHQSYGHTGHVDGFYSLCGYFPNEQIAFIIASNGTSVDTNDIAVGLLSVIFDLP